MKRKFVDMFLDQILLPRPRGFQPKIRAWFLSRSSNAADLYDFESPGAGRGDSGGEDSSGREGAPRSYGSKIPSTQLYKKSLSTSLKN